MCFRCGIGHDEDEINCPYSCDCNHDHEPDVIYNRLTDFLFSDRCRRVITMGGYDAFIGTVKRILEDKGETTRLSSGTET